LFVKVAIIKRRNFAEKESQMLMLIMVCEMRNLSIEQIVEEIALKLHIKVSYGTVYSYIKKMEQMDKDTFAEVKNSTSGFYINEVMKLKNHMRYYRANMMKMLNDKEFQSQLTPNLIMRIHDMMMKIDQTEFNMLEAMPTMFGGVKNLTKANVYGSTMTPDLEEDGEGGKDISQYISALEQHPIPQDLMELQASTEFDKLGTHMKELPDSVNPQNNRNNTKEQN
jgi:hypothetical protein